MREARGPRTFASMIASIGLPHARQYRRTPNVEHGILLLVSGLWLARSLCVHAIVAATSGHVETIAPALGDSVWQQRWRVSTWAGVASAPLPQLSHLSLYALEHTAGLMWGGERVMWPSPEREGHRGRARAILHIVPLSTVSVTRWSYKPILLCNGATPYEL